MGGSHESSARSHALLSLRQSQEGVSSPTTWLEKASRAGKSLLSHAVALLSAIPALVVWEEGTQLCGV